VDSPRQGSKHERVPLYAVARFVACRMISSTEGSLKYVTDIRSIKPYDAGAAVYVLRHATGKTWLVSQFTRFREVISRIKAANPQLEVAGDLKRLSGAYSRWRRHEHA
jgi:hypothetical protein